MDDLDLLLPTAALADAAVRLGIPIGTAPVSLIPLLPGTAFAGPGSANESALRTGHEQLCLRAGGHGFLDDLATHL